MKIKLSRNSIKIIAILAMVLDHVAYLFLDTNQVLGFIFRFLGRITYPLMAFMIVEGYFHTKNYKRYLFRMFVASVVAYFANAYFLGTLLPASALSTLFLGLFALGILYGKQKLEMKIAYLFMIFCLALLTDYSIFGVALILLFAILREKKIYMVVGYLLMVMVQLCLNFSYNPLIQLGLLLVIPLVFLYDGNKKENKNFNYFFYYFYPIHLVLLKLIDYLN